MIVNCIIDIRDARDRAALKAMLAVYEDSQEKNDDETDEQAETEDSAPTIIAKNESHESKQSNDVYFRVDQGILKQTQSRKAPYKATIKGSEASFEYNGEEFTLSPDHCQQRETILDPFCKVTFAAEDANKVVSEDLGSGTYDKDSMCLTVTKKAQVKLIRQ